MKILNVRSTFDLSKGQIGTIGRTFVKKDQAPISGVALSGENYRLFGRSPNLQTALNPEQTQIKCRVYVFVIATGFKFHAYAWLNDQLAVGGYNRLAVNAVGRAFDLPNAGNFSFVRNIGLGKDLRNSN